MLRATGGGPPAASVAFAISPQTDSSSTATAQIWSLDIVCHPWRRPETMYKLGHGCQSRDSQISEESLKNWLNLAVKWSKESGLIPCLRRKTAKIDYNYDVYDYDPTGVASGGLSESSRKLNPSTPR